MEMVENILCLVERFQALIAGVMALLAAWAALRKLSSQIKQAEDHHNGVIKQAEEHHIDLRNRKFKAARAVLGLALSRLCAYSKASLAYAQELRGRVQEAAASPQQQPDLPDDVIPALRDMVEFADGEIATSIANLISEIQVHRARLSSLLEQEQNRNGAELAIYDAVHLYVYVSEFFEYARDETDVPPTEPTRAQLEGKLSNFQIHINQYPGVYMNLPRALEEEVDG